MGYAHPCQNPSDRRIRVVLVPDRHGRVGQPDLGDKRPDRALAKRTSHGDAVAPVEYVASAIQR